jgi:hypothetical protein
MFGHGTSRRVYRVYPEDDFLGVEQPGLAQESPDGDSFEDDRLADGVSQEHTFEQDAFAHEGTAPVFVEPRSGFAPARGRRHAGVALLALVAMALSAIVVHTLRSGLQGGGRRSPTAGSARAHSSPIQAITPGSTDTEGSRGGTAHVYPASVGADSPARHGDRRPLHRGAVIVGNTTRAGSASVPGPAVRLSIWPSQSVAGAAAAAASRSDGEPETVNSEFGFEH